MKYISSKTFFCIVAVMTCLYSFSQQGDVTVIQDNAINKLLEYKKDISTVDVYKIQIYSGDRATAETTRSKFRMYYNEWPTSIEFKTPYYRIWVGNFRTRLEADRALVRIKKKYMNAFVFQPKTDKKKLP